MSRRHADPLPDPFREHSTDLRHFDAVLLGGRFRFESESAALLQLARDAFAGLPAHRLFRRAPRFTVRLAANEIPRTTLRAGAGTPRARAFLAKCATAQDPPLLEMFSGAGFLCGLDGSATGVFVDCRRRSALVIVAAERMSSGYHTRYELIEFATYTLATRALGLVPLHAACVAEHGRGALIVGPSGSGKSTLALHGLLGGLDFVAEDSVLVSPESLAVTGIASFVHIRREGLALIDDSSERAAIRNSPVIRRRSGVRKFEVDVRRSGHSLAAAAPRLSTLIFPSSETAHGSGLLTRVSRAEIEKRLRGSQPYAASLPSWPPFLASLDSLAAFELRRGRHPRDGVEAVRALLSKQRTNEAQQRGACDVRRAREPLTPGERERAS